jgi:addiction module RelB/DinJ family antitoxin
MAKTEMIRARVEPELKHAAEAVLKELGLTPTEAITLFYKSEGRPPLMRPIRTTRQFERDLKRVRRRSKDLDKLSLSSFAT